MAYYIMNLKILDIIAEYNGERQIVKTSIEKGKNNTIIATLKEAIS
jgi:hypothetical protein